jgi:protein TonB
LACREDAVTIISNKEFAMNFADHPQPGQAVTKITMVVIVHALLAFALVKSIANKTIKLPQVIEDVMLIAPEIPPPPPPPETKPTPKAAPPEALRPKVEVDIPPPVVPVETIQTAEMVELPPAPAPVQAVAETQPESKSTGMRTAVLAEGCATPAYPTSAARNGETGTVLLALLIGTDGRVSDAKVQKSSGSSALDKAARSALSLCRFKAATVDGIAQPAWSAISYVWKLD